MKHKEIHTPRSGGVITRHGNRALRLLAALALVAAAMILAVPAAAQHTPDTNTALLDSLDGTTVGTAYGTVSYEPSLPILGQAVDLETGDWIKYAVPSWYSGQGSGTGTVETWIYPRSHNIALGTLQWFNVSTGPSSGYLGGLSITADGHLRWSTWRNVSAGGDIPIGTSVIPLNEWTHVAATWSPTGTSLYVNGILDAYSVGNHDPYLQSTLYIYLNGWGGTDLGLVDEYRVSKTARSETEIRDYVVEVLNSAPVSDPNGPYLGAMGDEIVFDGTASSDPDNDPLVYNWDWGDGAASPNAGPIPTHIFVGSGMYDVCLTVNDGYDNSDEVCTTAVVYDPDGGFVTGGGWIESPEGAFYPSDLPYFDGSYYEILFSDEPLQFFDARDLVAGMVCDTCTSAHLATITSQGEYDTVLGLFDEWGGAVLGGYQEVGVSPPDVGWQWVTGEAFDFEATLDWWLPGEPNDCGPSDIDECAPGSEQVLEMYPDPEGWNDIPFYEPRNVFMVEYEDCDLDPTGKATFGFVSKYKKGATAPTGSTEFQFHAGDLNFHSTSYDWLVVTGSDFAKFKGEGTINGEGVYKFQIWAGDDDPDTFRMKIWTEDEFDVETVIYDNGTNQAIGGGSIVIHTKK